MLLNLLFSSSLTILCISPITIPNPNLGKSFSKGSVWSLKDCTSSTIRVPCGHCPECVHSKQMQLCQRAYMESLSNYLFFATLTYNSECLPRVVTSTGYSISFADWRDLQLTFKRLRKRNSFTRPFRYLAVSERGSKRGRPHFHILFFVPKFSNDDEFTPRNLENIMWHALLDEWKRNVSSNRRNPDYVKLLTYKRKYRFGKMISNYDLHYVQPSISDGIASVAFYVTKYMLKRSDKETRLQQALKLNLPEDEYDLVWDLVHSRVDTSLFFGLNPNPFGDFDDKIISYLRGCVKRSTEFAKFFNPSDGKSTPLAHYYKSFPQIYTLDDALRLKEDLSDAADDGFYFDRKYYSQLIKSVRDYEKTISQVADRGDFDNIGYLFDD